MEQGITLEQVQKTMNHLRDQGERISRRNVRAITGGGMTTVHRLMGLVEKEEALKNRLTDKDISDTFITACRSEISLQTKSITEKYEQQIQTLHKHEQELIDALTESETRAESLDNELQILKSSTCRERQAAEKDLAVATESIRRLESWMSDYTSEKKESDGILEEIHKNDTRKQYRIEALEQALASQEKTISTLSNDLNWARNKLNETPSQDTRPKP
jgi:chromosome segregation ATPase